MTLYKPWAVGGYEMHRTSGVPVYVDGRKAGTAKVAVTRHYACDGPVNRVELTEFDGTLGEKHLNLIEALDEARNSAQYWKLKYSDGLDRDETIDELRSEVERLRQSRKEQAEKHRQNMRNLQQNFEAREQAKSRNTKLQRQVKNLTRTLETSRADAEYWHGRFIEVEECLGNSSELAGQRDQWKEAYHQTLARSIEYADKMQNLRGELAVAKAERDRLLADINCFMKDFAEGATIINSAVEDWNATVPE